MLDMYEHLDAFIDHITDSRSGSQATADSYRRDIARFITYLKDQDIDDLSKIDRSLIFDYFALLRSGNISRGRISNATFARNLSALRSFYRYLCKKHVCSENPFLSFGKIHVEKHLPDVLTVDQIERILNETAEKIHTSFALSSYHNLIKSGRVSRLIGFIAGHLGFWGIGIGDEKGEIAIRGKARGSKSMVRFLVEEIRKVGLAGKQIVMCQDIS